MRPDRVITPPAPPRDAALDSGRSRSHDHVGVRPESLPENPLPSRIGTPQLLTPVDRVNLLLMQLAIDHPIGHWIDELPSDLWAQADPAEIQRIGAAPSPFSPPAHTVLWS